MTNRSRIRKLVTKYMVKRLDMMTGVTHKFGPIVSCVGDISKDANRLCRELKTDYISWVPWGQVSEYDKKDCRLPEDR